MRSLSAGIVSGRNSKYGMCSMTFCPFWGCLQWCSGRVCAEALEHLKLYGQCLLASEESTCALLQKTSEVNQDLSLISYLQDLERDACCNNASKAGRSGDRLMYYNVLFWKVWEQFDQWNMKVCNIYYLEFVHNKIHNKYVCDIV